MSDWQTENRFEKSYVRVLNKLIKQIFKSLSGITNPKEIVNRLREMSEQKKFKDYCEQLAFTMVTHINKKVAGTWRKASLENGKGREIRNSLLNELTDSTIKKSIDEQIAINATIIITLPQNIAEQVVKYIEVETLTGRRSLDIAADILKMFPEKTTANAKLIARTEVSKTQCALVRARAEALGLDWYIWRTSKDSRVRSSHDVMDGVLVRWSDPPNPESLDKNNKQKQNRKYHAGDIYNCRCYAEPVISWDLVKFPCKVYSKGRIFENVKKQDFMNRF